MLTERDNFEAGKLIIATNRHYPYYNATVCHDSILDGIDYTAVHTIFPATECGSGIGDILLVYLTCQKKSTVLSTIGKLSCNPRVVHAEPSYLFSSQIIPNDPYFGYLWGLENVNAPLGWNYTVGSGDMVVGVVDSGIDYRHPDVRDNMWVSPDGHHGRNFFDNNDNTMDITGHGTHVAGTIGATGNNAIGIAGVCWQVKLASLKIGDADFGLAAAIAAIHYANENNIPILNNSWGGGYASPTLKHVIDNYNGLFVASAGNSGADSDVLPEYPAAFDNGNILSVASTNPDDTLSAFSNYGARTVDIAAPGADILSLSLHGEYSTQRGTSMSAPHVAGAAALLLSYMPGLTPLENKQLILDSAAVRPWLQGKLVTGGVLDIQAMFENATRLYSSAHTVVAGESLWRIAANHGIDVRALIRANPQLHNPDLIFPGDVITVPVR
ncbi:MAG: S8 family serine peptidase [Defluviitaleaceae bacterium]|nr:S8 family serine peptidase [Defluviitaleaceae bacterium]